MAIKRMGIPIAVVVALAAIAAALSLPLAVGQVGSASPTNMTQQQAALSAFSRDYSLFAGAPSLKVTYGVQLNAGFYGLLVSMLSPQIVLYKQGAVASATVSISLLFQSYSASFYEANGTTLYCLGSSTWLSTSVARCGLVGNLSGHGISITSLNLSAEDFNGVSYLGTESLNGAQCDSFSGTYTGSIVEALLAKAGLSSGGTAQFNVCMNRQYGYVQQLNASISDYSVVLTATSVSTAPLPPSTFEMPASFVADWASCSGNSLSFYYVPNSTVRDPSISVSKADGSASLVSTRLNGTFAAYVMHRLEFSTTRPVTTGDNLSVCIDGPCITMECT